MLGVVKAWIEGLTQDKKQKVFRGLTREGVRQGLHHDDETSKQGQQVLGAKMGQPLSAQVGSSARAMNGPSGGVIQAIGSSSRTVTQNYSSGYPTSTYQSYTSSQRGVSSGTPYAQGMMTDYTAGAVTGKTVEFRMWPYNMDYYTRQDDYSLKHLSPYYQSMPSFLQSPSIFTTGQATYVPPSAISSSSTTLPSSMITSGQGTSTQTMSSGTSGGQYPTSLASSSSTLGTTYQGLAVVSQQTTPLTTITNSSTVPSVTPATLPTTVPGPASPTGQGTNSSYYGQVTDHGQSSPTLTSPTLVSPSTSPIQGVSQVGSMQTSLQNMNINV